MNLCVTISYVFTTDSDLELAKPRKTNPYGCKINFVSHQTLHDTDKIPRYKKVSVKPFIRLAWFWTESQENLPLDPAFVGGIVAEIDETGDVGFGDVAVFGGNLGDCIEVGEADIFDISCGEAIEAFFHAVSKDACDAENIGACFAEYLDYFDDRAAGGDEVFDYDDFLTGEEFAFDLIFASVILGA